MAGRRRSWGWPATVTVFAVGVALWSLRGVVPWELADQMGGVVGTALALVGFVQAWMQIRERRAGGDGSPADNLAQAVVRAPEGERKRLLGGSTAAVNITFRRRATPSTAGRPAAERGEFDDISGYYDTVHDGRLVITGGAGAGKTVLAMELIFALCTRREGDDPVPVRLPLAGWDGAGTFEERLIGRLVDEYGLPPDTARSLVKARKVIPVLDGLDEMDPDDADTEDSRAAAVGGDADRAGAGLAGGRGRTSG